MHQGISVIICCFNSASRLPETLKCLTNQKVEKQIQWEVIIVDNASTDKTSEIALQILSNYSDQDLDYSIVYQPLPGLSNARLKGVEWAKYDYIIFCDDDNWLNPNYIETAFNLINSNDKIGIVGGKGEAVTVGELPNWWEEFKDSYAVGPQYGQNGELPRHNYIWGAGMVTRKALYQKAFSEKYPSLLTGRKGTNLNAGEDTEYNIRVRIMGYKIIYNDNLIYKHFIPDKRLNAVFRDQLHDGFKNAYKIIQEYENQISINLYSRKRKYKELIRNLKMYILAFFFGKNITQPRNYINQIYRIARVPFGNITREVKVIANFISYSRKH